MEIRPAEVRIRRAEVADAPQIASVHVQSWQEGYRGQLPQRLLDGLDPTPRLPRWQATARQAAWPTRGTVLACDDEKLLGFADLCPTRNGNQDPAFVGEIASFYVLPTAWGHGIGRRLMAASIQSLTAGGYQAATLWVLATNIRAIGFYEALGWAPDGATKDDVVAGAPVLDLRYQRSLVIDGDMAS